MRGLLAAAAIVLAVYLYLAAHGLSALRVLAYNETELMPADAEFRVVESIVGPGGEPKAAFIVMFGPGLEEKARNLSRLYQDALTACSILDEAAREYARRIDAALSNATGEFRSAAVRLAGESKRLCDELDRLARAYGEALRAAVDKKAVCGAGTSPSAAARRGASLPALPAPRLYSPLGSIACTCSSCISRQHAAVQTPR
jgi:RND superfamily putative drug exporter